MQAVESGFQAWRRRFADRWAARRAGRAAPARGFRLLPEPHFPGYFAIGRQLAAGNFLLAGNRIEAPDPWAVEPPSHGFTDELHGFGWLDHLGAVGEREARETAQALVDGWIARFGRGQGPGWQPGLAGRRLGRWLDHALMLTAGRNDSANAALLAAMGAQMAFLARRWQAAPPGLARFEAASGWFLGALFLEGMADHQVGAEQALSQSCTGQIDGTGAIGSRNPQELAEILVLLVRCRSALVDLERPAVPVLNETTARVAETLRALRHVDGGLARFHGGSRGAEGRLERALAGAARKPGRAGARLVSHPLGGTSQPGTAQSRQPMQAMGYARLQAGRVSAIVDAAPPPAGFAARSAHASTLAFELTSNRRPLIVNCGPGRAFGAEWERAGRATISHSTLSIDGCSSARFASRPRRADEALPLLDGPRHVELHRSDERHGSALLLSHDGYVASHGLTHVRNLDLSVDGRALMGEDRLVALEPAHRRRLAEALKESAPQGIRFALRFHLHPEADASLDMNDTAVSVALPSGEVWVFRFDGPGMLSLEPSVYLETGRAAPRASVQIALRARMESESAQINWTLAKAQDTPLAIRDIGRDDALLMPEPLVWGD